MSAPRTPESRLAEAYEEATQLTAKGLEGLCPFYTELAGAGVRYRDHVLLGKGAIKEVYKTFDSYTHRWVAMACLRADRGPDFYDRFIREAWLTASLNHPNIIVVHDVGIGSDGRPFFTMDLKGRSTLAVRVADSAAANRREMLEVFMKVCDAVAYAHSKDVVHLDLKPENIQVNEFGEVLVCDWGLAKTVSEMEEEGRNSLSVASCSAGGMPPAGQGKGSLGYMAPEQVVSGGIKDQRSDIFALGCILHLILTGRPPFEGTEEEILAATQKADMIPPRIRYPEQHIPAALEAVVMKATSQLPDNRYHSAKALRNEIYNFLGGYSTLAENPGFCREARLFVTRNSIPVTIACSAIVALTILSVLFVQGINRQREQARKFESRAETVQTLYQDALEQSEQQRMQMARKLASSASDLKQLGIYLRPPRTVREALQLVESAITLNNESRSARLQRFSLLCITLNFKQALQDPIARDGPLGDYRFFTDAFPDFDYTEEHRPDIECLAAFIREAARLNPDRRSVMERIVAYDAATRPSHAGYAAVVEALINYINTPDGGHVMLEYDPEQPSLVLHAEGEVRLLISHKLGSNECMLRFIPCRSIKIKARSFCVSDLHQLHIETLDLRDCGKLIFRNKVNLPVLHRVLTRPGQIDPKVLREQINAHGPFELVESV